ncbi:MAG: hypothetical protein HY422_03455 [Candidatus Komeilibacteria bacterium]|nr:hypothetical protein [Candidatus Komeilibacteria bacterium]
MPKESFKISLSWYSNLPTLGPALEAIDAEMSSGKFLSELHASGIAFSGNTAYGPHTSITFEAETMAQGLKFADRVTGVLNSAFPEMPWIYIRICGKSTEQIVAELEEAIDRSVSDLRQTRSLFASRAIRDIRIRLSNALDNLRR